MKLELSIINIDNDNAESLQAWMEMDSMMDDLFQPFDAFDPSLMALNAIFQAEQDKLFGMEGDMILWDDGTMV